VPPTTEPAIVVTLRSALLRLPVIIEAVECEVGAVPMDGYPGGIRPTSLVRLRGAGATGEGENVAWTAADHARFAERVAGMPLGRWTLERWAATIVEATDRHERAALEAAAIDLALRQHRTNLFRLAGTTARPVRYVVSFGRVADPVAEAGRHPGVELKIDADPAWDAGVYRALAALGRVAVVDFKGAGTIADHERAHAALPAALIEDPGPVGGTWSESLRRRLSFDAPLLGADDLGRLPCRPAAANLKSPRMGGVLALLAAAERCAREGIEIYLGGMFEVDVGRAQAQSLAAVLSPDAPNDVALLAVAGLAPPRPPRLAVDATRWGFGAA
jgi:hypothetical protein